MSTGGDLGEKFKPAAFALGGQKFPRTLAKLAEIRQSLVPAELLHESKERPGQRGDTMNDDDATRSGTFVELEPPVLVGSSQNGSTHFWVSHTITQLSFCLAPWCFGGVWLTFFPLTR